MEELIVTNALKVIWAIGIICCVIPVVGTPFLIRETLKERKELKKKEELATILNVFECIRMPDGTETNYLKEKLTDFMYAQHQGSRCMVPVFDPDDPTKALTYTRFLELLG